MSTTPRRSTRNCDSSHVRPATSSGSPPSAPRWARTCATHEPEGATTASNPPKTSTNLRPSADATSGWPALRWSWPQHVWPRGKATSTPSRSRTPTVARPTDGCSVSARQVTKSATRTARAYSTTDALIDHRLPAPPGGSRRLASRGDGDRPPRGQRAHGPPAGGRLRARHHGRRALRRQRHGLEARPDRVGAVGPAADGAALGGSLSLP